MQRQASKHKRHKIECDYFAGEYFDVDKYVMHENVALLLMLFAILFIGGVVVILCAVL